jgi:ribosomal protein L20
MSKKQKLYNLRLNISVEAKRIKYLLESVIYKAETDIERNVLAEIALEKSEKISRMSEKIGIILKH